MTNDLEKLWATYEKLCHKLNDPSVDKMLDVLGERLIAAPMLLSNEHDSESEPGSLIWNTVNVTSKMRILNDALNLGCETSSILKVGLFHQLGRLGDLNENLLIPNDSAWHREKLGQIHKFNENVLKMTIPHRTSYLLQHFGIKLEPDEVIAIQLSQNATHDDNKFYGFNIPKLAFLLHTAKMSLNYSN